MSTTRCSSCGRSWPTEAAFCGACGNALSSPVGSVATRPAPARSAFGPPPRRSAGPPPPRSEQKSPIPQPVNDPQSRSVRPLPLSDPVGALPPVVIAIVLGFLAAVVVWLVVYVVIPYQPDYDIDPYFWRVFDDVSAAVLAAIAIGEACALTLRRSARNQSRHLASDLAVVIGCAAGGGVLAGLADHSLATIVHLRTALVFLPLGLAVGIGCALTRRVSAIVVAATGAAGVIGGLVWAQIARNFDGLLGRGLTYFLLALAMSLPIVLSVGLLVQYAPSPGARARPQGAPLTWAVAQSAFPPTGDAFTITIGEIGVTPSTIVTPNGSAPLEGSQWTAAEATHTDRKIPGWAIVSAVVFSLLCLLGLLFLLAREERTSGYVSVTVISGGMRYTTHIPVSHPSQVAQIHQQVAQAKHWAEATRP